MTGVQTCALPIDELQCEIKQMSFPGGRFDARARRMARATGYSVLHGSGIGALAAQTALPDTVLPRLAIRAATPNSTVLAYARADTAVLLRAQAFSQAKTLAKRLIGNARYHQLYARVKGVPHQQP